MRVDIKNLSDEELIQLYRDGEIDVIDVLIGNYKGLVRSKAKSMYILGGDTEDLVQEGMFGLFKAVRDFDAGRDASFHTFADLCISRQMFTAIEAANCKKHAPLNAYVSFDDASEPELNSQMYEILSDASFADPERLVIDMENVRRLEEMIYDVLSKLESQVFDLRLTGMSYVEIARVLDKSEKAIDNALGRMKTKVKKVVEEFFRED